MALNLDELLQSESVRFLSAIDAAEPTAAVPSCPGWSAHDLLWHLCEVQHFWAAVVGGRMADPSAYEQSQRPGADNLRSFFVTAHQSLVDALAGAGDEEPAWSWHDADQTVGFTRRRQVHEALIHRVDAELAAGQTSELDAALAADGIDEVLRIFFSGAPGWSTVDPTGPVGTVRCTDLDRSWLVQVQSFSGTSPNTGTVYAAEPVLAVLDTGDPTFSIAGAAADVNRWLWSRFPPGPVTLEGDTAGFEALVAEGME